MANQVTRIIQPIRALLQRLTQGKNANIFAVVYLAVTTLLVYISPRNLIAFLLFASSALVIFYLRFDRRLKVGLAILVALVLVPIVGVRNISYLEVIFQISVFAALALGLNIVVGFVGLLNLGYVAFYAVGAYLWAIFGSKQLFMLHSIPGASTSASQYFLPPDAFYLFLLLGMVVAAVVGI